MRVYLHMYMQSHTSHGTVCAICDSKNVSCIVPQCEECKGFLKLNDLGIDNFHCSKKCRKENIDCSMEGYTIKALQFERTYCRIHLLQKRKEKGATSGKRTHITSTFNPLKRQIAKLSKA